MTFLYRLTSGEVRAVDLRDLPLRRDPTFWGVVVNPPIPDGIVIRQPLPDGSSGPSRVLGLAKIHDNGTIRNATQPEINGFQAFEDEDENIMDGAQAKFLLRDNPLFRKAFIALAKLMMSEINTLRTLHGLPKRTRAQFMNALRNQVSKND